MFPHSFGVSDSVFAPTLQPRFQLVKYRLPSTSTLQSIQSCSADIRNTPCRMLSEKQGEAILSFKPSLNSTCLGSSFSGSQFSLQFYLPTLAECRFYPLVDFLVVAEFTYCVVPQQLAFRVDGSRPEYQPLRVRPGNAEV